MSTLDGAAMLADISDGAPAGENLENDDVFGELERAARGKPERQSGNTLEPAEDPDWRDVEAQASALTARTLDLRVLCHLAIARLQRGGVAPFAETLGAIRDVIERRWDHVHPTLDPEDDNDPTLRANALLALIHPVRVLRPLRDCPLVISKRAGRLSWRDISISTGAIEPPPGQDKLSDSVVRAAFADGDAARLAATTEALAAAIANAAGVQSAFAQHAGAGAAPDMSELIKLLREMARYVERFAPSAAEGGEAAPDTEAPGQMSEAPQARGAGGMNIAAMTSVTNRADAMRLLDLVAEYYRSYEPSSPLPFLLDRARRLAEKNFIDILRDMAPEGLGQAQTVVGMVEQEAQY